jgi:hypothetical protein
MSRTARPNAAFEAMNGDGLTFPEWLDRLDASLSARCGLVSDDLADFASWDAWNDAMSPAEAATMLLEDEGFPF